MENECRRCHKIFDHVVKIGLCDDCWEEKKKTLLNPKSIYHRDIWSVS